MGCHGDEHVPPGSGKAGLIATAGGSMRNAAVHAQRRCVAAPWTSLKPRLAEMHAASVYAS